MRLREKTTATLLIAIFMISIFTVAIPINAVTNTWYVDPTGTDDESHGTGTGTNAFKTIQYAIYDSRVKDDDAIIVAAGTYDEIIDINKHLTLEGANAGIDPTDGGTRGAESLINSVAIGSDEVTVDGFTVIGVNVSSVMDYDQQGAAIFVCGMDNCVIRNNIIEVNYADFDSINLNGINLFGGDYYTPARYSEGNLVTQNLLTAIDISANVGIKAKGTGNTITDNELLDWNNAAIHIWTEEAETASPDYNEISRNTIDGNDADNAVSGIWIRTGSHLTISDNYITGVGIGIFIKDKDTSPSTIPPTDITVSGNTIEDLFSDASWYSGESVGIWSRDGATDNFFTENTISGCDYGFVFTEYDNKVNYNDILVGTENVGLKNEDDTGIELDAEYNWWGTTVGSEIAGMVSGFVDYSPWLTSARAQTTWTVPWHFATIQEAIDSDDVQDGDTILVWEGEWYGGDIDKALIIKGLHGAVIVDGPAYPHIVGEPDGPAHIGFFIEPEGSGCTVESFTFRGGRIGDTENFLHLAVLGRYVSGVTVKSNKILNCSQCISNNFGSNWIITHNIIECAYHWSLLGIYLNSSYGNIISHNEITGEAPVRGQGIEFVNGCYNEIVSNTITITGPDAVAIMLRVSGISEDPTPEEIAYAQSVLHDYAIQYNDLRGSTNQFSITPPELEEVNTIDVSTAVYELQLYEGWNLIGTGPNLVPTSITELFNANIEDLEYIYAYEAPTSTYKYWINTLPENLQTINTLDSNRGYWIKTTQPITIKLDYIQEIFNP